MQLKIIEKIGTNNFNDEEVMQKITTMWKNASTVLSNHEGNIYGVYHAYESNYKGDEEHGVFNTWNDIWKKEEASQIERTYTYDFEKYYPDGRIEIYIAVQKK